MLAKRRISAVVLCLTFMAGGATHGSLVAQSDPTGVNKHLEIGPMPGLTTSWHPAPTAVTIPLDATVELRVRVGPGQIVSWLGAEEVSNDGVWSVARPAAGQLDGDQLITVRVITASVIEDTDFEESTRITTSAIASDQISVAPPVVWTSPVNIDKKRLNDSTYHYYRGESIADLHPVRPGLYRSSIDRTLWLRTDVDPPEFAPLVEWRSSDGSAYLGNPVPFYMSRPGIYQIALGPEASQEWVSIETYRTEITSHSSGDIIYDGTWTTFHAETDPPGYESEITWLASTRYGTTTRILHRGPAFRVRFDDTFGDNGTQWLGVKANETVFGQDLNGVDVTECTPPSGEAGTIVNIVGTGLPTDPDDVCIVLMPGSKVAARAFDSGPGSLAATVGGVVPGAGPGHWMVVRGEGSTGTIPDSAEMSGTNEAWVFEGVAEPMFEDSCPQTFTPIANATETVVGFDFIPCTDCFPMCVAEEGSLEAIVPDDACPAPPPNGFPVGTEIDIDVHFDVQCDPPNCSGTHFDCYAPSLTVLQHLDAADVARELADKLEQCFANQGINDIFVTHAGNRIVVFKPDCELFQGGGSIVIRPAGC